MNQIAKNHRIILFIFVLSCLLLQSIRLSGDGLSYYAYLRSALLDGDLDFTNEFEDYNPLNHATSDPSIKTKTGLVANPYSVGPAILWFPFVFVAHIGNVMIAGTASTRTGYELEYIGAAVLGTNFYAVLGLLAMHDASSKFFGPKSALLALLSIWFGTSYVNYLYFEPSYSHVLSASSVAVFLWGYLEYREAKKWQLLIGTAFFAGFMILTRWQNVLFFAIPAFDVFTKVTRSNLNRKAIELRLIKGSIFISIVLLIFSPQLVMWKHIYGYWIVIPMGTGFIQHLSPSLLQILISPKNGLFIWTPIIIPSLIGIIALYRSDRSIMAGLVIAIVAQWYLNASVVDWWGGSAFGGRRFIGSSVIFVVGLAGLLHILYDKRIYRTVVILSLALSIFWNLLLWTQYALGTPPIQSLSSLGEIYLGQFNYALPNIFRLLGRSAWLDMAFRSGLIKWEWKNMLIAIIWLMLLFLSTCSAFKFWSCLNTTQQH